MDSAHTKPGHDLILEIAARELATLPPAFRDCVQDISFFVDDFADPDILAAMEIDNPLELLGLYAGVSMDQASVNDISHDLDRIFLYREPLLAYVRETGEDLARAVRHVLIHEIGHHFGFSDEDMEEIEESD